MILKKILYSFEQAISHPECVICGSLMMSKYLLCSSCFTYRLQPALGLKHRRIQHNGHKYDHYFLILWSNTFDKMFSKYSRSLKGNSARFAIIDLILYGLQQDVTLINWAQQFQPVIIPVAGSNKNAQHAHFIAEALNQHFANKGLTQIKIDNRMKKITDRAQKATSRQQRGQVQMMFSDTFMGSDLQGTEDFSQTHLIVDDIVTTEATIKATLDALKTTQQGIVFSLLYRPKT